MNKLSLLITGIVFIIPVLLSADSDKFNRIKSELSQAECVDIEFISLLHSEIFDQVDSTFGKAVIANDGRYKIMIGSDIYYNDGNYLYSYAIRHNQVTIELADKGSLQSQEVTFITRLDELYKTDIMSPNKRYRLISIKHNNQNIPDSMEVMLNKKSTSIEKIEYYDVNEELNSIVMVNQTFDQICDQELFTPALSDSVEVIRMF